jgi:hypothetical protein
MKRTTKILIAIFTVATILTLSVIILASCELTMPLTKIYFVRGPSEIALNYLPQEFVISGNSNIDEPIIFYSGDENILAYDHAGEYGNSAYFRAISVGVTQVYAETAKGKLKAEMMVTVIEPRQNPSKGLLGFYGSGTEEDPYQIGNSVDLNLIASWSQDLQWGRLYYGEEELIGNYFEGVYFKLVNDILVNVMHETHGLTYANHIAQIYAFNGILDGGGYTITIPDEVKKQNAWTQYDMGMFYILGETAVIKNLTLDMYLTVEEFDPEHLDDFHTDIENGLIATYNNGTIENCIVKGTLAVKNRASYAYGNWFTLGGIAAKNYGTIQNCISGVDIIIDGYANSRNSGNQYYDSIGGLVGYNAGILKNSIYTGGIKFRLKENGSKYYIGALIGVQDGEYEGFSSDFVDNLYYDLNSLDIRTESERNPDPRSPLPEHQYYLPQDSIGKIYGEVGEKISGVSYWSSINFSEWNQGLWDFSGEVPKLRMFS